MGKVEFIVCPYPVLVLIFTFSLLKNSIKLQNKMIDRPIKLLLAKSKFVDHNKDYRMDGLSRYDKIETWIISMIIAGKTINE